MRIVLLADLHFGREDPDLVPRLLAAVAGTKPDLVLVAGDFVQRARPSHYRPARSFLNQLEAPWLAVPGNHDIPLFNLPIRLLAPRAYYRHWIAPDTEPEWENEAVSILGVDTTDRWSHQRGRITRTQIDRVCRGIGAAGARLPIILAHHPFHHRPNIAKKLMRGAPEALRAWADWGAHVILSGHLHRFLVEPFVARKGNGQTLQVHRGTSASNRRRGNANDFAVLDVAGRTLRVGQMVHTEEAGFLRRAEFAFTATTSGWVSAKSAAAPAADAPLRARRR